MTIASATLSGCGLFQPQSSDTSKTSVSTSEPLIRKSSFIPIIYPDRVVELDPKTGQERTIPDEDLIVEDGKVWGRYLRLGNDVEYTMSYHNHLCAPVLTSNIDTIGDSSQPVRSFAVPEQKFNDCKEDEMKKAVRRIQSF